MHRILDGIDVDDEGLAVECVEKVGPGGNYVTEEHTIGQMFKQFFYPTLSVRMNFDAWQDRGKPTPLTRAHEVVRKRKEAHKTVLDAEQVTEIKNRFPDILNA
ncbi:MAG TPA: hypothetical protein EYP19_04415 [Desulfobacterales bacterium]|nr:hypothetical protein [Desulfobacterales bacterium]